MKFKVIVLLFLSVAGLLTVKAQNSKPQRFIAITIDDLPVVSTRKDIAVRREITTRLLKHLTDAKVPAIGFVNEIQLFPNGKRDETQVDLLRQWLNAGLELGNHTFSHLGLDKNSLKKYEAEILRGEIVTKELLQAKGKTIRYFRHPYLITGEKLSTKRKLAEFLKQHNYTIAPVTFDDDDYLFARASDVAATRGDEEIKRRVGAAYVPYMESKADYWERQSVKLFGREIKQILLIHANSINAEHLGDLIQMFKKRGYQFITLNEALQDEAYKLPDNFTDKYGISWLHRWAFDKGVGYALPNEPQTPDFVRDEVERESK
ncbi:MAG: polysaccharide deacetylase family protein [Pyrinomonadaceae bacterium]